MLQLTTDARRATAAAEDRSSTATMQAGVDNVEKTRQAAQAKILEATAMAVDRQTERDEAVQGVRAAAPWAGLILAVGMIIGLVLYFAPVVKRRAQVVRRGADEGEPIILLERDPNGLARIVLPLRSFRAMLTPGERTPDQFQDRATARAQLANVVLAAQGKGKKRVLRRSAQPAQTGAPGATPIRVVEADQVRPWIEDARAELITGEALDGDS